MEPDPIAQQDQALAQMRNTAQLVAAYYRELMQNEVHMDLATALTIQYQMAILGMNRA